MPNPDRKTIAAALLGTSAGMRTFTPAAVLVARGRLPQDPPIRKGLFIAAGVELIGDKLPFVPSRTKPLPYLGRVASGAYCGHRVAGQAGALVGAAAAAAGTSIGHQARKLPNKNSSALVAALLEDALAIGAANLAVALVKA